MIKMQDYSKNSYIVNGQSDFSLSEALSLWKTKYSDLKDFKKDVINHESLEDFGKFVEECWNDIKPVTVEDALKISNTEIRRTYFDCIGVEKLFKSLEPVLLDKQTIKKKRVRWDDEHTQEDYEFEDVYELYEIDGLKLFNKDRWGRTPENVFAVRCWCTTTNREYWLYVTREAAYGVEWWSDKTPKADAIRAIAWTIRVDVPEDHIERIYRQGDIIVAKIKDNAPKLDSSMRPYHISKNMYLSLMYSET